MRLHNVCRKTSLLCLCIFLSSHTVASLGWVTPGAATDGVTPLFFPEKLGDLFLLIAVTITIAYRFLLLSLGCLPSRVGCHLFFLSDLVSPLFFINLPAKFFSFGCHPPDGVTRGGPPPHPLVTPLISQTANKRPVNSTCICEVWFQAELIKLTPMLSPSLP